MRNVIFGFGIRAYSWVPSSLAIKKTFEFVAASLAFEKTGREAWNEKGDRIERLIDALLPLLTPGDVLPIVKNAKI